MAGRRTSVYLTEDLAAAVDALGVPLPDLIREAVAARTGTRPVIRTPAQVPAQVPAQPSRPGTADCPHPEGRVIKGLCNACGTGGLG